MWCTMADQYFIYTKMVSENDHVFTQTVQHDLALSWLCCCCASVPTVPFSRYTPEGFTIYCPSARIAKCCLCLYA